MPGSKNEALSRVLIDKAQEFSGWDLLDPHRVRFELNGATGRADFDQRDQAFEAFPQSTLVRQSMLAK